MATLVETPSHSSMQRALQEPDFTPVKTLGWLGISTQLVLPSPNMLLALFSEAADLRLSRHYGVLGATHTPLRHYISLK